MLFILLKIGKNEVFYNCYFGKMFLKIKKKKTCKSENFIVNSNCKTILKK